MSETMEQELNSNFGEALERNVIPLEEGLSYESFVPFPGRVLVEPLPADTEIRGIFLPAKARQEKAIGYVRRVSPGESLFEPGDLILFAVDSGDVVTFGGVEYKVLMYSKVQDEGDILGHWPASSIKPEMLSKQFPEATPAEQGVDSSAPTST